MDWIGPSSNGLSKYKNHQAKFIWFTYMVHMVFTSRDWFQHYVSLFTLIQARKCWMSKTLTLAGDMQWTNTPSTTIPLSNLNFSHLTCFPGKAECQPDKTFICFELEMKRIE